MRRKQDQKHKQWRQNANAAADDQQQRQRQKEQQQNPENNTQQGGGVDPADRFESGQQGQVQVGNQSQGQQGQNQQQPPQQVQQQRQQAMQQATSSVQQQEPYEHNCDGYPGKAEFWQKVEKCPRCGKTLAWDHV